ncbi:MAG: metallopeptidase TldD-related protein [Pseudomonadota bacterium]|nr:metallopeptidase TldD-related protein [Pseudomonadota bacterium]
MTDRRQAEADALTLLDDLLARAVAAGADAADAVMVRSLSMGASWRMGKAEDIERSEGRDIGLRVLVGQRQAVVSGTDFKADALDELAARAVAMARISPEDRFCGLADPALLAGAVPDLDLDDGGEPDMESLLETARITEEAALAVAGVKQSEGASASAGGGTVAIAIRGPESRFSAAYSSSSYSVSCSVIAADAAGRMERDYDYSSVRHRTALEAPAKIGTHAAERAVRRVGARKMGSARVPVIFDPRIASSLVGHFAGAINGQAIARGTSFLKDSMGRKVFADGITITDDPLRRRGLRSRPVDGEGVTTRTMHLVDDGVLTSWVLDSATALQLGLQSTGHASRGTSAPPAPGTSNLYLANGTMSPADLIADIAQGFYVTELIGFGVNGVTGDYSRGAAGFWIEKGEIAFPVSEMTVAGNLKDMFLNLVPANDLEFRAATNAPTVRVDGMTVAGA